MKTSLLIPVFSLLLFSLLSGCEATEYEVAAFEMDSQSLGNMYGKVVDQNGNPVVGAKVRGYVRYFDGGHSYFTETDSQGRFKFLGLHGLDFGVAPTKDGYALYTGQNWSKDYKPDPNNPMVFALYKLQGAEPMVHTKFGRTIPCDGTATHYDLFTGKEVGIGDGLVVTFLRNPVDIHRGKPFEWTLTLNVPGGGLIEIKDDYPYEAPVDGYQETITLGTGPDPKNNYLDSVKKTYYYKSADGKYGRLFISLQADFQPPPTSFGGSIFLNPSGSRNLEWDEEKEIKP
jgi:hypothetical protein